MLLVAAVPAWTKAEVVPGPWQQYVLFIVFALRFYQLLVPGPWQQYLLFIVFALRFYQLLVALLTIFFYFLFI